MRKMAKKSQISFINFLLLIFPIYIMGAENLPKEYNRYITKKWSNYPDFTFEWRPECAYGIDYELELQILKTCEAVHRNVKDFNGDNKVDCIDHTVLFKTIWDRNYPELKSDCTIMRIYNKQMHHLCIGIYDDRSKLILVESQMSNNLMYFVNYWYRDRFKKTDIIYGETAKWLKSCKITLNK